MKILLLGSQHGNERLGEQLYRYISKHRPSLLAHVEYKVANPKAFRANVRYIETDMNRSYSDELLSYEARRARRVLEYVSAGNFDLVLDLHTTTCEQPPSVIVANIQQSSKRFLNATSIQNVVVMRYPLVESSINAKLPQVVSVELNKNVSRSDLESLCEDIERYCNEQHSEAEKYIYEVKDVIDKTSIDVYTAGRLVNFELSNLGFYPVLVGENSYKKSTSYLGFKAHSKRPYKV